jgi:hypothetical protein
MVSSFVLKCTGIKGYPSDCCSGVSVCLTSHWQDKTLVSPTGSVRGALVPRRILICKIEGLADIWQSQAILETLWRMRQIRELLLLLHAHHAHF